MKRTITTILAIIFLTLTAASALVSCQNVTPDGGEGSTTPADDPDAGKPEWSGYSRPNVPERFECEFEFDLSGIYPVSVSDEMAELAVNYENISDEENSAFRGPIFLVNSYEELVALDKIFTPTFPGYGLTNFQLKYGSHDFEKNALVIAYFYASSGSNRYAMSHVDISDGALVINILQVLSGITCDSAGWTAVISVPREKLAGVTDYGINISYGDVYEESDADDTTPAYFMLLDENLYMLDFGTEDGRRSWGKYSIEWEDVDRLTLTDDESGESYVFDISDPAGNVFRYVAEESTAEHNGLCDGDGFEDVLAPPEWATDHKPLKIATLGVTDLMAGGSAGEICDQMESIFYRLTSSAKGYCAVAVTAPDGADRLKERYGYDVTAYGDEFFEKNYILVVIYKYPVQDKVEMQLLGYDSYAPKVGITVTHYEGDIHSYLIVNKVELFEVPSEAFTGRVVFAISDNK